MTHSDQLDKTGLSASLLCLAHCLAGPFVLALFPTLNFLPEHGVFHWLIALPILLVGMVAFYRGYILHHRLPVVMLAILGFSVILGALFFSSEDNWFWILSYESGFMVLGSILLIAAHWLNIRSCHCSE